MGWVMKSVELVVVLVRTGSGVKYVGTISVVLKSKRDRTSIRYDPLT